MSAYKQSRHGVPWPAAPGNGATIVMACCKVPKLATGAGATVPSTEPVRNLDANDVNAIEIVWLRNDQASAANGVRLYAVDDAGTYREVDLKSDTNAATIGSAAPVQVPVLSTGQEWREFLDVSRYINGWAVEYTAGATGPTNWNGCIVLHLGAQALVR
jgi:hypothetical protein